VSGSTTPAYRFATVLEKPRLDADIKALHSANALTAALHQLTVERSGVPVLKLQPAALMI
jgi:hypothetical protein